MNYILREFDVDNQLHVSSSIEVMKSVWGENEFSTLEYINWQYKNNPYGKPVGFLAYDGEERVEHIAAQYITIPTLLCSGAGPDKALQSVNTATKREHQGKGLFALTAKATYALGKARGYRWVYGFPNDSSFPGFKKFGFSVPQPMFLYWRAVATGQLLTPSFWAQAVSIVKTWRSPSLTEVARCDDTAELPDVSSFAPEAGDFFVPRSNDWLRFRYLHPTRTYHCISAPKGALVVRVLALSRSVRIAVVVDVLGEITASLVAEFNFFLKRYRCIAACGIFSSTVDSRDNFKQLLSWRLPEKIAPRRFHVIALDLQGTQKEYKHFFSLGDNDII